jgi:hypothetical protein
MKILLIVGVLLCSSLFIMCKHSELIPPRFINPPLLPTEKPKSNCAIVWEHCNFQGRRLDICGDIPDLSLVNFENIISSHNLGSDIKLIYFKGKDFTGDKLEFVNDLYCLNIQRYVYFNDHINSIKLSSKVDETQSIDN